MTVVLPRFEYLVRVPAEVVDAFGHVNNIEYVRWVQDAASEHSRHVGYDWPRYATLGAAFVVRRHTLEYLRSARAGDELTIATWLASTARISSQRITEITDATGATVLRAETTWVWVALDTMRPQRIPSEVRRAFGVDPPLEQTANT